MSTLLEDEKAIRELLHAYCFCMDRGNADELVELFTKDCVWDGGPWGRAEGRRALHEFLCAAVGSGEVKSRHLSANEVISITRDTAVAHSYALVMNVSLNPPVPLVVGHYEDQLVKVGGRWLFKSRRIRNE